MPTVASDWSNIQWCLDHPNCCRSRPAGSSMNPMSENARFLGAILFDKTSLAKYIITMIFLTDFSVYSTITSQKGRHHHEQHRHVPGTIWPGSNLHTHAHQIGGRANSNTC